VHAAKTGTKSYQNIIPSECNPIRKFDMKEIPSKINPIRTNHVKIKSDRKKFSDKEIPLKYPLKKILSECNPIGMKPHQNKSH